MTIDELVLLLKASQAIGLTTLQELILRSSWEGKTYTNIAYEAKARLANACLRDALAFAIGVAPSNLKH